MDQCIFCRIATGEIPKEFTYQDDKVIVFTTIQPEAPVHELIVPREHIRSIATAQDEHEELLGHLFSVARRIAPELGLEGYKTLINVEPAGGQEVMHIHMHLLGGTPLSMPAPLVD